MSGPPHEEKRTEKLPNAFGPYDFTPVGDRADRGDSYLQRRAGQQAPDETANAKAPKASGDRTAQPPKSPLMTGTGHGCGRKTGAGGANARPQKDGRRETGNGKGQKASESQAEENRAEETGNSGKPGEV